MGVSAATSPSKSSVDISSTVDSVENFYRTNKFPRTIFVNRISVIMAQWIGYRTFYVYIEYFEIVIARRYTGECTISLLET